LAGSKAETKSTAPRVVRLSFDDAAIVLGWTVGKLRRAAAEGSLRSERDPDGELVVVVDVAEAELPAPAAARLVGIAPVTMRAWIAAKKVRGRRVRSGWLVRVEDLLVHPNFPSALRSRILGLETVGQKRKPRMMRELSPPTWAVHVRISEAAAVALQEQRRREGGVRHAIERALLSRSGTAPIEDELAAVRNRLEASRAEAAHARGEAAAASEKLARFPRTVFCSGCSSFVSWDALEEGDEHAGRTLVHRHRGASVLLHGASTPVARR
jgi:hypothetical protein